MTVLMQVSGKLVIGGIVALALLAAGTSWWFRYAATHRAAEFLGPVAARLIRDAPMVEFFVLEPAAKQDAMSFAERMMHAAAGRDISKLPGITHLRNALLEDRSYVWPAGPVAGSADWRWGLKFSRAAKGEAAVLLFTSDWTKMTDAVSAVSCEPIAGGLATMLGPISTAPAPVR